MLRCRHARAHSPTDLRVHLQAYELVSKHQGALQTNRYWVDLMSGLQLDAVADKTVDYVRDFVPLVKSIQASGIACVLVLVVRERERGESRFDLE